MSSFVLIPTVFLFCWLCRQVFCYVTELSFLVVLCVWLNVTPPSCWMSWDYLTIHKKTTTCESPLSSFQASRTRIVFLVSASLWLRGCIFGLPYILLIRLECCEANSFILLENKKFFFMFVNSRTLYLICRLSNIAALQLSAPHRRVMHLVDDPGIMIVCVSRLDGIRPRAPSIIGIHK